MLLDFLGSVHGTQGRFDDAFRRKTNTYAKTTTGLQRLLDVYWVIHNFVRFHFTTREVPAVYYPQKTIESTPVVFRGPGGQSALHFPGYQRSPQNRGRINIAPDPAENGFLKRLTDHECWNLICAV
jgi:hypothetical protein